MTITTEITDDQIATDEALCNAATPGPWTASSHGTMADGSDNPEWFAAGFGGMATHLSQATAAFIARARTALPAYIAEVKRLAAALTESERVSALRGDGVTHYANECGLAKGAVYIQRQRIAELVLALRKATSIAQEWIALGIPDEDAVDANGQISDLRAIADKDTPFVAMTLRGWACCPACAHEFPVARYSAGSATP